MQYFLRENFNFDGPGPPKTGPKRVQNWVPNRIFDAEALDKPLESLLERSWTLLERSWTTLGALLDALGAQNTPTRVPRDPRLNLSKWWDRKAQC